MQQDKRHFETIIIGAGMAGISVAEQLAKRGIETAVLDQSQYPPEHSTSRSVALFSKSYAPTATVSGLITASEAFFMSPPAGFTDTPLLVRRETVHVAADKHVNELGGLFREMASFPAETKLIVGSALLDRVPILRTDYAAVGILETDSGDLDPAALWAGYRKSFLRHGGRIFTQAEVHGASRRNDYWSIASAAGQFTAQAIVNAAGAWADVVAEKCGARPLGLVPLLRTAMIAEPTAEQPVLPPDMPFVFVPFDDLYFRSQRGSLTLSPADEQPSRPADVQPDDEVVAWTIAKFEEVTTIRLKPSRPKAWAGLRTFAPDRNPVVGYDPSVPWFFWLAGQGGSGIETAPAMSGLAASLILHEGIPEMLKDYGLTPHAVDPSRIVRPALRLREFV